MKATLPIATDILLRYTTGDIGCPSDLLRKSDAFAAELIRKLHTATPDSHAVFFSNVDHLVTQVLDVPETKQAATDATVAITEYFNKPDTPRCTSPEDAAAEILHDLTYHHGRAGFLLGFCLALRLHAAVGGGR